MPKPWVNRRKTLRIKAEEQYPGRTARWFNGKLHFTRLVEGKHIAADLVPGIEEVRKGPHPPSKHKKLRQKRRANMRNGAKLAAQ